MFTVRRLGVPDRLARSLSCTNAIESMISVVRTLTQVAAAGAGLSVGVFFAFSSSSCRHSGVYPHRRGIAAMQAINRQAPSPLFMTALFGTAAVCVLAAVGALGRLAEPWAAYVLVAAALYLVVSLLTVVYHVPRDGALAVVDSPRSRCGGRVEDLSPRVDGLEPPADTPATRQRHRVHPQPASRQVLGPKISGRPITAERGPGCQDSAISARRAPRWSAAGTVPSAQASTAIGASRSPQRSPPPTTICQCSRLRSWFGKGFQE